MSQAPQGQKQWFQDHYEKIILLIALIALLFSSVWLVKEIQVGKEAAAFSLQRIGWRGSQVSLQDTVPFDTLLAKARAAASAQLATAPRTTVSEVRVSCVKCGRPIPFDATTCPFCLGEQPEIIDSTRLDTDGDGIPDWWEIQHGLDPLDPTDAHVDHDGDGFTALEEYLAGTDPRDPESYPDPIVKLRVLDIRPVPFVLRYVGTQRMPDSSLRFLLNLQTLERSYFAKEGDVVLGYKVQKYEPEGRGGEETLTMVRQSDQRPVVLIKGRPVTEQELAIRFVCLLDRKSLPIQRLNDVFEHRGTPYKVVDIRRDSVVLQGGKTDAKVTVPRIAPHERQGAAGPSAGAPAPGGAADAPW